METQDGFILGIYNYCDRWCERCSLASRCRVYTEDLKMSLQAPPAPAEAGFDRTSPVLRSLGAVAAAFAESSADEVFASGSGTGSDAVADRPYRPDLPPAESDLQRRVHAFARRLSAWLAPESRADEPLVREAAATLQHFGFYIGPKVYRALSGRKDGEADGMLSDALGSAKAAFLAFDRIGDAWLGLAECGAVSVLEAAPMLTELQAICADLDRLFPRARDFVRPGFDEPEALALLEWRERG
jgi:hypothetical protein